MGLMMLRSLDGLKGVRINMKPLAYREIWKESNSRDSMPQKTERKWKKKERQRAKKEIRKEIEDQRKNR